MKQTCFNEGWTVQKVGPTTGPWAVKEESVQQVTLPHDAMLHDKRDPESPSGGACSYFVPGAYEYRKTFFVPGDCANQHLQLNFGGVYQTATVSINGKTALTNYYGYAPFTVDLDPYLIYDADNTVTVLADNTNMPNTRWYSGAGIYRNVYLEQGNKTHIQHEGVKVTTLTINPARIQVDTAYVPENGADTDVTVVVNVLKDGNVVATGTGESLELDIPDAKLWSAETPELYTAQVLLKNGEEVLDEAVASFGIRTVAISRQGLFINGVKTLMKGGCVHHDNGLLGAVSVLEAEERRMRILKENGFNSVRCAHNHASYEMVQAADKVGMYLMDETWDMWYIRKNKGDYSKQFAANWEADVEALINKDYNSPSVIMYSIGNELSEPYDEKGIAQANAIKAKIKSMDTTRPVTAGINLLILAGSKFGINTYGDEGMGIGEATDAEGNTKDPRLTGSLLFNTVYQKVGLAMNQLARIPLVDSAITPFCDVLDVAGYNYGSGRYKADLKNHPNRVIIGSETLPPDIYVNWKTCEENPALVGDYMWAAWDYLGEAGVGTWNYEGTNVMNATYPWVLAGSGVIDITGYPGAAAKYASTVWGNEEGPYIGVRPVNHPGAHIAKSAWRGTNAFDSWSWQGCDGNKATVEVYDQKAAFAKLQRNGHTVGILPLHHDKAVFKTTYEPGVLTAITYDRDHTVLGRAYLYSATGDIQLKVTPEQQKVAPGQIVFVNLTLEGSNGVVESNQDTRLTVKVDNGELLGLGNANAKNADSYCDDNCSTYYGRAQAIVRVGASGKATITVKTESESVTSFVQIDT